MAIDAYTGRPRSGKSYSVVKNVILPSLKEGRHVFTNIPLTELAHDEFPGLIHQLHDKWYEDADLFDSFTPGCVAVLDELWRRWPKGMAANKIPHKDKAFLAEHGHLVGDNGKTTRVIFVTQDLDQLSHFCLTLIDKTYQSHKLDSVGASGKFRIDIYEGAAKGQRPPKTQFIRSTFDSYSEKVWVYYKSATKSNTDDVGDESRADKRATIWRSPFLIFSIVAPFIVFPLGIWYVSGLFASGFGAVKEPESVEQLALTNPLPQTPQAAQQAVTVTKAREKTQAPQESLRWRVTGHIQRLEPGQGHMVDVVMIGDGQRVVYLAMADCEPVSLGLDYRCQFNGEWVTPWSGPRAVGVTESVLGAVPFAGGERSESTGETVQQTANHNSLVNPPPAAL